VIVKKIDHIGIAVTNIDRVLKFYTESLGLKLRSVEIIPEHDVRTAILQFGDSKIELLESTSAEGAIAKFIEKKGEGLHHLALEVNDVREAIENLRNKGVILIDNTPRPGVENTSIAFVHPKESRVLLELVEPPK
jgi:lactoylglutathione lyase/methylmalonyl-CoA/ethylmalonyl-CoA epimerase